MSETQVLIDQSFESDVDRKLEDIVVKMLDGDASREEIARYHEMAALRSRKMTPVRHAHASPRSVFVDRLGRLLK